jgi:hypothetical protein
MSSKLMRTSSELIRASSDVRLWGKADINTVGERAWVSGELVDIQSQGAAVIAENISAMFAH